IAGRRCNVQGGCGFTALSAGDGINARLVGRPNPAGALRDVETCALRSAERLIPQAAIANLGLADQSQQLASHLVSDQILVRQSRPVRHCGPPSKTPKAGRPTMTNGRRSTVSAS